MIDPFYEQREVLAPEDIADGVAYMVTRPRHASIAELWIMPTDQASVEARDQAAHRGLPCSLGSGDDNAGQYDDEVLRA
ncbi:hypothetical protein [Pseudarthrobacter sp. SSS035]|uniref:hypothetical protein n=1 Tax=Pseudarthrobacter sp. SSS035 TaxID=2931399 RepID=UPI002010AEE6|nr:hypothetical protein [Pseudarthrobacter sp. SSS035]